MRISDALGERIPLAVQFPSGSVLNIVYSPASYTVAELETLSNSADKNPARIIEAIRRIVLEWDLTDDSGQPVPVAKPMDAVVIVTDPETGVVTKSDPPEDPLRHVPTPIFTHIIKAVNEDQSPGESRRP